jgi:hypothetical protein
MSTAFGLGFGTPAYGHASAAAPPFNPVDLFGATGGALYDFTDPTTLFTDTTRTTLASLDGKVQGVSDISGKARHLSSASTTGIVRRTSGLEFQPAANLTLVTGTALTGSGANGWTACMAIKPDAALGAYSWMDAELASFLVGRMLRTDTVYSARAYVLAVNYDASGGTVAAVAQVVTVKAVQSVMIIRVNGVQVATVALGAGALAAQASGRICIGAAYNSSSNANAAKAVGFMYAALQINRGLTTTEMVSLEAWMAAKAGL